MTLVDTPSLDQLKSDGTWTDHFVPVFPTISLTNHTSYMTGCLPGNHGILNNKFYDPERGLYDHSPDADWRTGCLSLFEVAEGQGLRSAVLGYAGRMSSSRGPLASRVSEEERFEDFPSDVERANQVLELLALEETERPELIVVYFKGPDGAAHFKGIDSTETIEAVRRSDTIVGQLKAKLAEIGGREDVALFVGTDHGMVKVTEMVNIVRILKKHKIRGRTASSGANGFVYLDDAEQAQVALERLSGHKAFRVYAKGAFPAYANLGDSPRAPDLLVAAHPPYAVEDPVIFPPLVQWLGVTSVWPETFPLVGALYATHGYDPAIPEMHGIFYAWGTQVKRGQELPEMSIIDVHPTVLALMGLEANQDVDGKIDRRILAPARQ